eukprot:CAMPEP_0113549364 /NCGR_PEP_ID=MMETSP0015_2-20120614/13394_1 /TAXON_ID=2838 /ORGANISM="Odontella" /LENGTH=126 /DNA_ID=CAMNT_0000450069 /DNA_START=176 /DNA_END=556 /DNA_ORIENTATION=- /assembly_acc=CAM_ASM_000160
MVTPAALSSSPTQSRYLLLVVKILLVLLILLILPKLVDGKPSQGKKRRKLDRRYLDVLSACETGPQCGGMIYEESLPCVTECLSNECHGKVYGNSPLELGEVDERRYKEFEACAKRELREAARRGK